MTAYVYKITRVDDLSYIGITVNPERRFLAHKKSNRFELGIKEITILEECDTYEIAEEREEYYIDLYDTYKNGLNVTATGKGKNAVCKFNTYGHIFSETSKKKMSASAKERGTENLKKFWKDSSDEEKQKIRKKIIQSREGTHFSSWMFTQEQILEMRKAYHEQSIDFSDNKELLKSLVKKTQHDLIGNIPYTDLIMTSGHKLTYKSLFIKYFSEKYGCTKVNIARILDGKGYKHVST